MTRRRCCLVVAWGMGMLSLGCSEQKGGMEGMSMADMKPPTRPAELDRLNMLVGEWEGTYEMTMPGSKEPPMKSTGRNRSEWDCDRWCVVEHGEWEMGGSMMKGIGVWTWDAQSRKYRNHWVDSMGATMNGEATFNQGTQSWSMKSEGHNPMCGKTYGEGTMKFVNDRTIDWSWKEWSDSMKMNKIMEMKGTSRKM